MNSTITSIALRNGTENFQIPASLARTTLLYFMRSASCPMCSQHVKQIQSMITEINKYGLDVIIIVPEDVVAASKLKVRYGLTIPVMSGDGTAYVQVGLEKKMLGLMQQSGTIIADIDGTI